MQKIAIGLSAVFLIAAASNPANPRCTTAEAARYQAECIRIVAEYWVASTTAN